MTAKSSRTRVPALAFVLFLALTSAAGLANAQAPGSKKPEVGQGAIVRGAAIFLAISIASGYVGYFGLFPRLLRKENPAWPLDAWRRTSYGVWLMICLAVWAGFRTPLRTMVITPIFNSFPGNWSTAWGVEMILIPVMALIGLLAIWNFRRNVSHQAQTG